MNAAWPGNVCRYALPLLAGCAVVLEASCLAGVPAERQLVFSCAPDHELFRILADHGITGARYATPRQAVNAAGEGAGVLILAGGYPARTTPLDSALLAAAARKQLRLYVEYPSFLPGLNAGSPRVAGWERAVVTSGLFGPALPPERILSLHQCSFVPVRAGAAHLVLARVAGFDTAVFGLPAEVFPLLFELPPGEGHGPVLVATAQLSRPVTARYGPIDAWPVVWKVILRWLSPELETPELRWTPTVRPTYGPDEPLPADVEARALQRGIEWFVNSQLLLHPSRRPEMSERAAAGVAPPLALDAPTGDGSLGILEGYLSRIQPDGRQLQTIAQRGDCTAESAMALALGSRALDRPRHFQTARNLLDFYYFSSPARKGERADPAHGAYGLVAWGITTPAWRVANYGDDNARLLLGTMATAALTGDDRWDEPMLRCLLANLRTTGPLGFRGDRIDLGPLGECGWEFFFRRRMVNCAPHYESYLWACYLWAYRQTGFALFRERATAGIRRTMAAYPDGWRWTNGLQQERARMLLPLAWLVRVEDTPEHRAWLRRITADLLVLQESSGALREEIGALDRGQLVPPASNEAYGSGEAPLLQQNGDPVCDLLYTCNFAFIGLHEAAAATGDAAYTEAEDRLARFLCRIQIRSERHPELDGGWFRAFDFRRWDYWGSSSDSGWGAWCIESGWTEGWISSVLALRQLRTSLWDLTARSTIGRHLAKVRAQMIPDTALTSSLNPQVRHAAVGKPVALATAYSGSYPGDGPAGLTDGWIAGSDHLDPAWLGCWEDDLVATIDFGHTVSIAELRARFLQNVPLGIFLPRDVEFLAGDTSGSFRSVRRVSSPVPARAAGPLIEVFAIKEANVRARYLQMHARNVGRIPSWHQAAGQKAWLFADEIMVNPSPESAAGAPAGQGKD